MVVDKAAAERTMHTEGKMYGLTFDENWFIIGESDGSGDVPAFKLVAYKGHTLQGAYRKCHKRLCFSRLLIDEYASCP